MAAGGDYLVVTARSGVAIRNSNCKKIGALSFGELLTNTSSKTINCKVSGRNIKMTNISRVFGDSPSGELFVASNFLTELKQGGADYSKKSVKVNAVGGLNLRNDNCKRVTSVPNGTELNLPTGGLGGSIKVCRAGNQFYSMNQVDYNGKLLWVADFFVK